ncbi:MAG: DUF1792 domain-containing protein [Clostridium sp.]|nr:DUF1792 domain-containing protein [Clostridium sp.]
MGITIKKWKLYGNMFYQCFSSFNRPRYARFYDNQTLIDKILNEQKSLIRYGDGEFDIIEGKSIHYQEHSLKLGERLDDILCTYIKDENESPYIIAMPEYFFNGYGFRILFSRLRLSAWSHSRYLFHKRYDKKVHYGDAFLFHKDNEQQYRQIWEKAEIKKIIFVHNNVKYAEIFLKKYKIKTDFIKIPSENAYKIANDILKKIKAASSDEKVMVLISAGPCGKILAYELAKDGIWAIDTGHCWDAPLDKNR